MKILRTRVATHMINKGLKKIKSPTDNLELWVVNTPGKFKYAPASRYV